MVRRLRSPGLAFHKGDSFMAKSVLFVTAALALAVTAAASAEVAKNSANYMMPGCRDFLDLRS